MGHRHSYWYSQGAFRCKKCGHVTYGRPEKRSKVIIVIPIIIIIAIAGYFIYQTYGMPQSIQSEASKIINNASNTVQQISSQVSQQSTSLLHNQTLSFTNQDNRVPIAVYENCNSLVWTQEQYIQTTCNLPAPNYGQLNFKFTIPEKLQTGLPSNMAYFLDTKVYKYGSNDFKIWLSDQTGGKNYTVNLWQLP